MNFRKITVVTAWTEDHRKLSMIEDIMKKSEGCRKKDGIGSH